MKPQNLNNVSNEKEYNLDEDHEHEREDGLKVKCENDGETYLKEVDATLMHFTVIIKKDGYETELQYGVLDNEESFDKEFFFEKHGDTLKNEFNEEQINYITENVGITINNHLSYDYSCSTLKEEYELATEFFGATGIEVNKVKIVKNDEKHNCITTIDYHDEKYTLNLQVEKKGNLYEVDMESLDIDTKNNKDFKEKINKGFTNSVVSKHFNLKDIEGRIKKNIESGIAEKQKKGKKLKEFSSFDF